MENLLSLHFWFKLLLAFVVLVISLVYINRSKIRFIQKIRVARLRSKLISELNAIEPVIGATLKAPGSDLLPLFKMRASLEFYASKTNSLFDIEKDSLTQFLVVLSKCIAQYDMNNSMPVDTQDLMLLAQRTKRELTELS